MSQQINHLIKKIRLIDPNLVFMFMLAVFLTDSVVNFFINIPIFVPVAIIALPLLWFILWKQGRRNMFLLIFTSVFILVSIINNFVYQFDKKNISDLVFILFFPTVYYFYKLRPEKLLPRTIHVFFVVSLLMFSFAFAGINSGSFVEGSQKWIQQLEILKEKKAIGEMIITRESNKLDIIEAKRNYNNGLFRIPHLATYIWGFFFLFYGFTFHHRKKWYFMVAMLVSLLFMLYSGSRAFLVAASLAFVLFMLKRKTLIYLLMIIFALVLSIIYRYELHRFFENTILEQFTSLLVTVSDNFDSLSRVTLWRSWWYEMQQFAWYDFLVGKTYIASMNANFVNIHYREWFHNDFLSITFAYGIFALILYLTLFYKIYHENSKLIRKNIYLFVYFFAMLFSAVFNGFYYYFPVFLMFIFIYMIGVEKKVLRI